MKTTKLITLTLASTFSATLLILLVVVWYFPLHPAPPVPNNSHSIYFGSGVSQSSVGDPAYDPQVPTTPKTANKFARGEVVYSFFWNYCGVVQDVWKLDHRGYFYTVRMAKGTRSGDHSYVDDTVSEDLLKPCLGGDEKLPK